MDNHTSNTDQQQMCGNFDLHIESIDELFADDNKEVEDNNDIQLIGVYFPTSTEKEIKVDVLKLMNINFDAMPSYLSQLNGLFPQKIQSILPGIENLEDIRIITFLIHKITFINIKRSLWIAYHKLNQGDHPILKLHQNQFDLKLWPQPIIDFMKQSMNIIYDTDKDDLCFNIMNDCFKQLDEIIQNYRSDLFSKLCYLNRNMDGKTIQTRLEKYVENELLFQSTDINCQIALIPYHYMTELLKHQYLFEYPNVHQLQCMRRLNQLKYDQEKSKHEFNLLKQRISLYTTTADAMDKQPQQYPSFMNGINDMNMKQELFIKYKNSTEEARKNLMSIHIKTSEAYMNQCDENFNNEMKQISTMNKNLPVDEQLTPTMQHIIEEQFKNIMTCFQCAYKFRFELVSIQHNKK